MVKDRAAPFSRKHRRVWIPITGGMILLGLINLAIGMYLWNNRPTDHPRTEQVEPRRMWGPAIDAGVRDAMPTPR